MAEFPKFPLWTDAYLADTPHLTTIEHGAYLLLLIAMWRSRTKSLPNDDKILARYAKLTPKQWGKIKYILMPFFTKEGDSITQRRLTDEATAVKRHSLKQSQNARHKPLKYNETQLAMAMPSDCQTDAPYPYPYPIPKKERDSSPSGDGEKPSPEGGLVQQDWKTTETEAVNLWNETAARIGSSRCVKLTPARKSRLKARLKECVGIQGWKRAMELVEGSPFLRGEKTDWRADFDFVLQEKSFTKLMEGGYSSNGKANGGNARDTAWVGGAIQKLIAAGITRKEIGVLGLDGLSVRKDRDQWLQGKIKELSNMDGNR